MPIVGKRKVQDVKEEAEKTSSSIQISKQEASFIASKLTQATYQGAEFDMYYRTMQKLKEIIDSK